MGQEHVTSTLNNALAKGLVSHAYLFSGPRGVGKTSVARILAYSVNELPYDETATHLDIIEIDAASNRRVDEIRDLREKISNAPAAARYKVYIIDEVHMLTKDAFNALLKTLEEPPRHAIFILATTEAHKLPETIISRTQRFTFKPISAADAAAHLAKIAKDENIAVTPTALDLIARHGDGSLRDSISLLDQAAAAAHGQTIDDTLIRQMLGEVPASAMDALVNGLASGQSADVLDVLSQLNEQGIRPEAIARQLASRLRDELVGGNGRLAAGRAVKLLGELVEVPASHDPAGRLEIVLLEATLGQTGERAEVDGQRAQQPPPRAIAKKPAVSTSQPTEAAPANADALDAGEWQTVLNAVKTRHSTLYGLIRMAEPDFAPGAITLKLTFPFHQKRLSDKRNQDAILAIIKDVTGKTPTLDCRLAEKQPRPPRAAADTPSTLANISNIFGGAEVVD